MFKFHSFKMASQAQCIMVFIAFVAVVPVPIWVNNELRFVLVLIHLASIPQDVGPMMVSCYFGFHNRIVNKIAANSKL